MHRYECTLANRTLESSTLHFTINVRIYLYYVKIPVWLREVKVIEINPLVRAPKT